MNVYKKLILVILKLIKLKFDASAEENMKADLEKMLAFVDKLNEIDTEGVDPLIYMSEEVNVLREDKLTEATSQKDALKNAPEKDSDYFKVPTVLKK
ncbi:MAG: Asp-tRNA(Asn)/Glu-tRNA(Gln) amidotransferase subunit GatC [Flavobacteriales bacterium]|nr:Asp-tRNA(Asn)/Glu-tRNA(Gln) amidotransferase subunit GatC [Flavobacteriales bacterium]